MTPYDWFLVVVIAFLVNRVCAMLDDWAEDGHA